MVLLFDENFPKPVVDQIRAKGFTAHSVVEECAGAPDESVLAYAVKLNAWLISFDLDFGELVFRKGSATPPCVVIFRVKSFQPIEVVQALLELLKTPEIFKNNLVIWTRERVRFRPLPLRFLPNG
jgi:predicted nuclease of predicted toxin-antitoxin system